MTRPPIVTSDRDIKAVGVDLLPGPSFTQVPNAILGNPDISVGARLAYALLLKHAWDSDDGRVALDRLTTDIGLERKDVHRYLEELAACNLLEIEPDSFGGADRYKLNLPMTKREMAT